MPETKNTLAKLSLKYVTESKPNLVAIGGNAIPTTLQVVDEQGNVVALYTAGSVSPQAKMATGIAYTEDADAFSFR